VEAVGKVVRISGVGKKTRPGKPSVTGIALNRAQFNEIMRRENSLDAQRRYYGQFVTPAVKRYVGSQPWVRRALREKLEQGVTLTTLNNVGKLLEWAAMHKEIAKHVGDSVTRSNKSCGDQFKDQTSDYVCIAKEAARQVYETMGGKVG
jgi:hypothetical protein